MRGGFEAGDDPLTLGAAASTMMGCPEPQGGWNRPLAEKLRATKSAAVVGDTLVMMDEAGETAGTFRAVYLPRVALPEPDYLRQGDVE